MKIATPRVKLLTTIATALAATLLLLAASGCRKSSSAHNFPLVEVTGFGSNPGGLQMFTYVPPVRRSRAPLVVVMHGCTQDAQDFADHSGWPELAGKMKFLLVFPQQPISNNFAKCFHWFQSKDATRDSGEALSIKQMIDRIKGDYDVDPKRVYVTGLSAGAAMTSVMLATYPDVFAGGAMMAGVPYGCATELSESFACMQSSVEKTSVQWGDLVRHATKHRTSWPIVSIWQGTADHVIAPINAHEEIEQWTDIHGLSQSPSTTETVAGYPHQLFKNSAGKAVIEFYSITSMGHGQAINPGTEPTQCGSAETFFYAAHICAAYQVARFWEIDR